MGLDGCLGGGAMFKAPCSANKSRYDKVCPFGKPGWGVREDQKSELLGSFPSNHDHHQALASTNIPLGALGLRLTSANDEEAHIHDSL